MKIAIVTGASAGLGKVFAEKICIKYPDLDEVWLIARRKERMESFAADHPEMQFRILPLDLALDSSYEEIERQLQACSPNVRILINNAGYCRPDSQIKAKESDLLQAMNVDVKGVTMIAKACMPYMHKGSFQIIVGSVASFSPLPGQAVYSASKVYEKYFAVALHEELKPQGINVMYLAPGNMATEMMALTTETIRDHGAKISHLPYLNLDKVPVVSLKRAEAGKRFYTPLLFNKAFRAFMKLIPASLGAKISSIE